MKYALALIFIFFTPQSYALYGEKIVESREACVVALFNQEHYFCSGVLIAPRLVLTAGHCIDMESIDSLGTSHALLYRPELVMVKVGGEFIPASSITLAPSYFEGLGFDTEDLALIELATPSTVLSAPIASKADLLANTSLTLIARSYKVQTKLLNSIT
jgi:secreted trypsin-like serine protease